MIYVSEMRAVGTQPHQASRMPWCRMQSNVSVSELDAMAARIGVSRGSFCGGSLCGRRAGFYYVLTEKQRKNALSCGATAIKLWDFAKLCSVSHEQAKSDWEYLSEAANGRHGLGILTEAKKVLEHWQTEAEEAQRLDSEKLDRKEHEASLRLEQARHSVPFKPEYSQNQHILEWWTGEHDQMMSRLIASKHWVWHHRISEEKVAITPKENLERWRDTDPLCKQYAWNNILWNLAAARAEELGLTEAMRQPTKRLCPLCGHKFSEDS